MVEHDELIQDLHEDLKEWIITREHWSGWFQTFSNKIFEKMQTRFSIKNKLSVEILNHLRIVWAEILNQISDFAWWEKIFKIWPKDVNLKYLSILTITHSFPPHNDI